MDERLVNFISDYLERATEDLENLPLAALERVLGNLGRSGREATEFNSTAHRAGTYAHRLAVAAQQEPDELLARLPALRRALGEGGGKSADLDDLAVGLQRVAAKYADELKDGSWQAYKAADPEGAEIEMIKARLLVLDIEDYADRLAGQTA